MKISISFAVVGLIAVGVISLAMLRTASADDTPVTDEQIARIRSNCVTTRNTLNQLHASDAYLRVDRGQLYQSIITKLMTPFNERLLSNNLDVSLLAATTSSYSLTLDTFRTDYQAYEEQLSDALNVDCNKEPVTFYDDIIAARAKRSLVHDDVVKLNGFITTYSGGVDTIVKSYQVAN
jgi:hypothetical protein